jgi:hypothetical protein
VRMVSLLEHLELLLHQGLVHVSLGEQRLLDDLDSDRDSRDSVHTKAH